MMNFLYSLFSGYRRFDGYDVRDAKLDFVRACNWLGGGEASDEYYAKLDVEKEYDDWTAEVELDVDSPRDTQILLLRMLANPESANWFYKDHIGCMVRSVKDCRLANHRKSVV